MSARKYKELRDALQEKARGRRRYLERLQETEEAEKEIDDYNQQFDEDDPERLPGSKPEV